VGKSTTLAVDLAKFVFEVAVSDRRGRVGERQRLKRPALSPSGSPTSLESSPCKSETSKPGAEPPESRRPPTAGRDAQTEMTIR
jgi:hypothetical protein